jgi:monovalent cation:H+ antiporter, CPA1 family
VSSVEVLVTAFLAVMMVASYISLKAKVPYTLVLVILGIALSATSAVSILGSGSVQQVILQMRSLFNSLTSGQSGGLFVGLVVPPLLFEAMIHIRSSDLKSIIRPSFVMATVGVIISTVVAGLLLWKIAGLPIYLSFLFGAIISPTDVATVLEIFRRSKVPTKLSALMDTEAAFNDATGIVVFSVVLASSGFSGASLISAGASFVIVFGGGVLVGLAVAFAAELFTSLISDKLTETILTISAVYGSYALASSLGVSGLIAVAVVGLYFGNFTIRTAMGPTTRETVNLFWEFAAFLGNSIAFLFIGFRTNIFQLASSIGLISLAYIAVTVARAASVYPILSLFDRFGEKIPFKWRNVAMLGGMRGALSIALAVSIPLTVVSSNDQATLTTLVLGVAFISISVQAALLFRYIKRAFPADQRQVVVENLNVRLSKAASAIEALQKLKEEGKISDEEFAVQLDNDKEELEDVLRQINSTVDPKNILRDRAAELYSSVLTTPVTRARQVFGKDKSSKHRADNVQGKDNDEIEDPEDRREAAD